eukprot:TRINITY_DN4414_c0_g1_i1.p1 TRINITY_DN4414_c0_g1~~TRINITY_DN4414_c0_g1_i1.p1  ORF type:complete len:259 (-),score=30.37 TRINITY_DN4414_c0_g1_i1:53-829(-)
MFWIFGCSLLTSFCSSESACATVAEDQALPQSTMEMPADYVPCGKDEVQPPGPDESVWNAELPGSPFDASGLAYVATPAMTPDDVEAEFDPREKWRRMRQKCPKPPENREELLVLCATFHHLFLFDSKLQPLAALFHAVRPSGIPLPAFMVHMERLSLIEYIPELSVVLVGSQGLCSVAVVRVVRNETTAKYELLPEQSLPRIPSATPVVGMTVERHVSPVPMLSYFRVHILYFDRRLFCYDLRSASGNRIDVTEIPL